MQEKTLLEEIQEDYKNPKKPKKERKQKSKGNLRQKITAIAIILFLIVTGVAYAAERYVDWRAEHEWQFPAKWIGFVRAIEETVNPVVSAKSQDPLTDIQVIEKYYLSPVLKTVYFLESTSGENDGCKKEGKFNGFGYRQNSSEWKCYDSFEQVTEKVNEWFEDRLATNGNDLVEAACYYNKGIQGLQVCDYSVNFVSVLADNF